jgi:hypothetical protein
MPSAMFRVLLIVIAVAASAQAGQPRAGADALLERADLGALMPPSVRAAVTMTVAGRKEAHALEIWRAVEDKMLIRFMDPSERGRYLVRLGPELWLLTKGAKKPVRISNTHRLYGGATIDSILGNRLAANYKTTLVRESDPGPDATVTYELTAMTTNVAYPHVRYTVRTDTGRPAQAVYGAASGKPLVAVDFVEWMNGAATYPRRLHIRDLARKNAPTEVLITNLELRVPPQALFNLHDHSARLAL